MTEAGRAGLVQMGSFALRNETLAWRCSRHEKRALKKAPEDHSVQFYSPGAIAPMGQASALVPQSMQTLGSMV